MHRPWPWRTEISTMSHMRLFAGVARPGATALAIAAILAGCNGVADPGFAKIEDGVAQTLGTDGQIDVFVSLVPPAGYGEPGADLEAMKHEIARSQDEVLAALDPADYRNRIRYETIPALAGTVLTRKGLETLEAHPEVVSVAVDEGGSGS
jgi:hypothetical protein